MKQEGPMTVKCDMCETPMLTKDIRYVTRPRPSDPTELVAIMWICESCAEGTDAHTSSELEEYFESGKARNDGLIFLSI